MKGVILETRENEAIVLTPDGEFRSVSTQTNEQWQIGDEITVPQSASSEKGFFVKNRRWPVPAFAVAASVLLVFATIFVYSHFLVDNTAVAYVNMDMNPSVELSVNQSLEVLSLAGLNANGEKVVDYLEDWSHESLHAVTLQIFQIAKDLEHLQENHEILVATSLMEEFQENMYDQMIYEAMQEVEHDLKQSEQFLAGFAEASNDHDDEDVFHVYHVSMQENMMNEAKEQGLSPGKYYLYQQAMEQGQELDAASLPHKSVQELRREVQNFDTLIEPDAM